MRKISPFSLLLLVGLASRVEASPLVGEWVCPDIGQQVHLKISADGTFSTRSNNPNTFPWSGTWKEGSPNAVTLSISPRKTEDGNLGGFTAKYKVKFSAGKMTMLTPAGASFENCALKPAESAPNASLRPSNPFAVKVYHYSDAVVSIDPRSIEIKKGLLDLILTYDFDKPTPNLFGTNMTAQHVQMHTQFDCRKRARTMLRITATTPAGKGISYVEFNPGWSPVKPDDGLFNDVCARAPRIHNDYLELQANSTCVGACDALRRSAATPDHLTSQRCQALKPVASPLELSRAGCL
jgi:hypothetical protein